MEKNELILSQVEKPEERNFGGEKEELSLTFFNISCLRYLLDAQMKILNK